MSPWNENKQSTVMNGLKRDDDLLNSGVVASFHHDSDERLNLLDHS